MRPDLTLRAVRDTDAEQLVALVGAAYAEHPGCVLDLPGVDADLQAPATTAAERAGPWWVLEHAEVVVATVGAGALDDTGTIELKRLYLDAAWRGQGLAGELVRHVEAHARTRGARRVELWSDTRFAAAHHRYARLGYRPTGETRELHDPSQTTEYRFVKPLGEVAADG